MYTETTDMYFKWYRNQVPHFISFVYLVYKYITLEDTFSHNTPTNYLIGLGLNFESNMQTLTGKWDTSYVFN